MIENPQSISNIETKEKPSVLYIGTHVPNIAEFKPMRGNYRDEEEGPVIFSTPDKALASVFLIEGHGDHWTRIGYYNGILVVYINIEREEFIKKDKGGFLYTVSSDTFSFDPHKGMGEKEWTSREKVKPLSETRAPSVLDLMIENGVQVYFVDKKTFNELNDADDYGLNILKGLVSENERRGKNVQSLK